MSLSMEGSLLVAGCYERFVFGVDTGCASATALRHAFTLEAHLSAVKCAVASGGFVATGGSDDLIRCACRSSRRLALPAASRRRRPPPPFLQPV